MSDKIELKEKLAAETNVTLHNALERAKMLYRLIEVDTK